jgi:hypothetical protein
MPPLAIVPIGLALLVAAPAQAQSARGVLAEFGFRGEWSADCGQPPGPDNSRRVISGSRRSVKFVENLGEDYRPNEYVVVAARRIGRDTVTIQAELNGENVQELTIVRDGRRMRTTANVAADGKSLVKDGVVVASKRETPWLSRCR